MRALSVCLLISALFACIQADPWPLEDSVGWVGRFYALRQTYGNFDPNAYWIEIDSSFDQYSFHNGIDIAAEDAGTELVRTVEGGLFTDCRPFTVDSSQWFAIIRPMDSDTGWLYAHVQGDDGYPALNTIIPYQVYSEYGDTLGTMAEIPGKHLHLCRTDQLQFANGDPGVGNPLDYLSPAPLGENGYKWKIFGSESAMLFLPQHDAINGSQSWTQLYDPPDSMNHSGNRALVLADTLDRNHLSGEVDVLYGCHVQGFPRHGSVYTSGIPQRIGWDLLDWRSAVNLWKPVQTRYLVDFVGELGAAPGDWQEFRRLYFPYKGNLFGVFEFAAYTLVCLTNCDDSQWWNGLSTIDEGCWMTDGDIRLNDNVGNPVIAAYRDGPHRLDAFSFAYDTTVSDTVRTTVILANFYPVVEEIWVRDWEGIPANEILETDHFTGYYGAHWYPSAALKNLVPAFEVFHRDTVPTQDSIEVVILFSEPVITNSVSVTMGITAPYTARTVDYVRAGNWHCPPGYCDTWFGKVLLGSEFPGIYTLSITGMDRDSNWIMDPAELEWTPPSTPFLDQYHRFYADTMNTEPPLDLSCELSRDGEVHLFWTLLNCDPWLSGYRICRREAASDGVWNLAGTSGPGDGSFVDRLPNTTVIYQYRIIAFRGTSDLGFSNTVTVTPLLYNAAAGCPIRELVVATSFASAAPVRSSGGDVLTAESPSTVLEESRGNVSCLTDGLSSEAYLPGADAVGIEIDLGAWLPVMDIVVERNETMTSAMTLSYGGMPPDLQAASIHGLPMRFVQLRGLEGATEVWVLSRELVANKAEITPEPSSTDDDGWVIPIPLMDAASTGIRTSVFDLFGRMIWTSVVDPSLESVFWEGPDDEGVPVPPGLYLVLMDLGDEVLTGKLFVHPR